jgi:hypothetical protein
MFSGGLEASIYSPSPSPLSFVKTSFAAKLLTYREPE